MARSQTTEAHRRTKRKWRENNAELNRSINNRCNRANPEARRNREAKRRAKMMESKHEDINSLVLLELHDGECGICGEDVDPFDYHVDHIIPISKGGSHTYANVQIAHPLCNIRKSDKVI